MEEKNALRVGCLLMAAGASTRYHDNKLLAEFDGEPMILRALRAIPAEQFQTVTVVSGQEALLQLAGQFGFHTICNRHPEWGVSHTIRLGTEAMRDCDAILYLVADQPLLRKRSVARVVEAWRAAPEYIIGAAHEGKRGNPCIFPSCFFDELMALTEDHGGNRVIRAHLDRLRTVELEKEELSDVDTPQAMEEVKQQERKGCL